MWCPFAQQDCEEGIFGLEQYQCQFWDTELGCLMVAYIKVVVKLTLSKPSQPKGLILPDDLMAKLKDFGEHLK